MAETMQNNRPGPFFIVTSGRSGSRLLAEILHRSGVPVLHSGLRDHRGLIYESGELNHQHAFIDKLRYDVNFDYSILQNFRAEVSALAEWYQKNLPLGVDRGPVIKDPRILHLMPAYRELFPHSRFIHIVRDGRDFAISKNEELQFWKLAPQEPQALLRLWNARMRLLEPYRGSDWFHELRFEDLLESPQTVLDGVWSFLELSAEPVLPPFDHTRKARHRNEDITFRDLEEFEYLKRFNYI